MRVLRDGADKVQAIKLERSDTLEEMAAMASMTMEDLASTFENIIMKSWEVKK